MLSVVLGAVGLATVLCLLYPQLLTVADAREYYQAGVVRIAVHLLLITAFVLGCVSIALRQSKILGFSGMLMVLVASLLGGSHASSRMSGETDVYFGLDFFLLIEFVPVIGKPLVRRLLPWAKWGVL